MEEKRRLVILRDTSGRVPTAGLTLAEEDDLIAGLGKVGQPWSEDFCNALAPLVVMPTVELVCFWGGHVLLFPRPASDQYYPGQLHSPGTLLRMTDQTYDDALGRIITRELAGLKLDPRKVAHENMISHTPRGVETHQIYMAQIGLGVQKLIDLGGEFHPANDLPANTMEHHRRIISAAHASLSTGC